MRRISIGVLVLALSAPVAAQDVVERSYLILANGQSLPADLDEAVEQAGGTLESTIDAIGIAVATSSDDGFADQLEGTWGIRSVIPDRFVPWVEPGADAGAVVEFESVSINPPDTGDDDWIFDIQWYHDAVNSPEAWQLGARGNGVRVAVVDSGIAPSHLDLATNVNMALAVSFVPGENADVGPGSFWNHGTHVAGIIGAADNGYGVIGIAPEVEIVPVKVLSQTNGWGRDSWVIAGLVYAADIGADVINMSLGGRLAHSGAFNDNGTPDPGDDYWMDAREVNELIVAYGRAANYAHASGAVMIAAAMNDASDGDHDADTVILPAMAPHTIAVSATAPVGWRIDPTTDMDVPAPYSNYGKSLIDLAAPGGALWPNVTGLCKTPIGATRPCRAFDLVISTTAGGGWTWASGTSMSAAVVSGVAALVIGENGGDMHPDRVRAILERTADDLGKPGNDDFFGGGRVNALEAVLTLH